jgi:hypothetical protein
MAGPSRIVFGYLIVLAAPAIPFQLQIVRLNYMHNPAPMDVFALLAAAGCMNLPSAAGVWKGMGRLQFQVGECWCFSFSYGDSFCEY